MKCEIEIFWDVTKHGLVVTDVSEEPIVSNLQSLSRNVGNWLPIHAAQHHRRTKISFTPRWKPEVTQVETPFFLCVWQSLNSTGLSSKLLFFFWEKFYIILLLLNKTVDQIKSINTNTLRATSWLVTVQSSLFIG